METVTCNYCNAPANLESSIKVYRRDYGLMYICSNYPACDAYVGVHKSNNKPLGRLANKELRQWKNKAHAAFDPLWQAKYKKRLKERGADYRKSFARSSGYKWLANELNIDRKDCHVGMFDVDTCKRVVEICSRYKVSN